MTATPTGFQVKGASKSERTRGAASKQPPVYFSWTIPPTVRANLRRPPRALVSSHGGPAASDLAEGRCVTLAARGSELPLT